MKTGGHTIPVNDDVTIVVDSDAMHATLEWSVTLTDTIAMCSTVRTACETVGIVLETPSALAALVAGAAELEGRFHATIACGTPPAPPVHGRLEWNGNYFEQGYAIDPQTGRLDYRRRIQQCNVGQGQLLARLHPPQEGQPGVDVYGRTIAPAKPEKVTMRAGANVRFDELEQAYYAEGAGRLRYAANVLSVDELLVVNGSIGLETGHVHHPGALHVDRDISEGAEVDAAGDIEVCGVIESATVHAGGNIYVHGGITGDRRCNIHAGGSIRAKYISHADIDAGGNIEVEREIDQSIVRTRGAVLVPQGRIVGGTVIACAGIAAGQLGSDAAVPTEVVSGIDFMLPGEIGAVEQKVAELKHRLEKIAAVVDAARQAEARLSPQQREMITLLIAQQAELEHEIAAHHASAAELETQSIARRKYCIVVQTRLCSDVILNISGFKIRTKHETRGPVRAALRSDEVEIVPIALRDSQGHLLKATA